MKEREREQEHGVWSERYNRKQKSKKEGKGRKERNGEMGRKRERESMTDCSVAVGTLLERVLVWESLRLSRDTITGSEADVERSVDTLLLSRTVKSDGEGEKKGEREKGRLEI